MKQGKATSSMIGSTKTEPRSQAVNVGAVSRIGTMEVRPNGRVISSPVYEGRGLQAPMKSTTSYNKGSQGKH